MNRKKEDNPFMSLLAIAIIFGNMSMASPNWGTPMSRGLIGVLVMFATIIAGYILSETSRK